MGHYTADTDKKPLFKDRIPVIDSWQSQVVQPLQYLIFTKVLDLKMFILLS